GDAAVVAPDEREHDEHRNDGDGAEDDSAPAGQRAPTNRRSLARTWRASSCSRSTSFAVGSRRPYHAASHRSVASPNASAAAGRAARTSIRNSPAVRPTASLIV